MESNAPKKVEKLVFDFRQCELAAGDEALCRYAIKLTLRPSDIDQADVDLLKQHGFDDHQITIAAQVIGYFNYINRIANGLDVQLEDWMTQDYEHWRKTKPDWSIIA